MSNTNHSHIPVNETSLPWEVVRSGYHEYVRSAKSDQFGNHDPVCCADGDAGFIAHACNNHAPLVDALEAMLFAVTRGEYVAHACEQARNALAKAKGGAS